MFSFMEIFLLWPKSSTSTSGGNMNLNLTGWWNEVQTWRYESRGITTFWSKPIERLGSNAYNIICSVRYMKPIILKMLIETPILFHKLLCFCENRKWELLNTVTICHHVGAARRSLLLRMHWNGFWNQAFSLSFKYRCVHWQTNVVR